MKTLKNLRKYDWTGYIAFAIYLICFLFIVWVLLSWINVIIHNETDHVIWAFNFFRIFMRTGN